MPGWSSSPPPNEHAADKWEVYGLAFGALGATRCRHLRITSRQDANSEPHVAAVAAADGIFITGGDQKRLLALIGGTALDAEPHTALDQCGTCLGGTSAGASAMSGHMLAESSAVRRPEKNAVSLAAGLGLLHRVVIDQHFSERRRLARLMSVVAQNPYLQGSGIDEETALVVQRGVGIEVLGQSPVAIIDGRTMITNVADVAKGDSPEMIDVRLHLLPSGSKYRLSDAPGRRQQPVAAAHARTSSAAPRGGTMSSIRDKENGSLGPILSGERSRAHITSPDTDLFL